MPLTTLHFTGWTPPTVASFVWYVLATFAGFKRRVLIVSRGATVNAAADVVTRPSLSVAVTPNAKIPAFWGVPAIVPRVASSTTPEGNAPDTSDQVYVPLPPVAVKVFARRIPTSLLGGRAGPNGDFTLRGWRTVSAYSFESDRAAVLRSDDKAPAAFGRGRPGEQTLRREREARRKRSRLQGPRRLHVGAGGRVQARDLLRRECLGIGLADAWPA